MSKFWDSLWFYATSVALPLVLALSIATPELFELETVVGVAFFSAFLLASTLMLCCILVAWRAIVYVVCRRHEVPPGAHEPRKT